MIIAINGKNVTNEDSLLNQLEQFSPGDTVEVTTLKDEKIHNYKVQLVAPDA